LGNHRIPGNICFHLGKLRDVAQAKCIQVLMNKCMCVLFLVLQHCVWRMVFKQFNREFYIPPLLLLKVAAKFLERIKPDELLAFIESLIVKLESMLIQRVALKCWVLLRLFATIWWFSNYCKTSIAALPVGVIWY